MDLEETKSNWECVAQTFMQNTQPVEFGHYAGYWFRQTPCRVLRAMSYYKFAAKLIGTNKQVLDLGCNEGIGTFVVGKECGFAQGVDFDKAAIAVAKKNFPESWVEFYAKDLFTLPFHPKWDAVISFDVIEHIAPENSDQFFQVVSSQLTNEGVVVIGTPSEISQTFASSVSKAGHINIYSHERLENQMRKFFQFVFLFSANDEVVHTGFLPLAHYFIAVGCKKIPY